MKSKVCERCLYSHVLFKQMSRISFKIYSNNLFRKRYSNIYIIAKTQMHNVMKKNVVRKKKKTKAWAFNLYDMLLNSVFLGVNCRK